MSANVHIVDFELYCPKCKHGDKNSVEDPCNECLGTPVNYDSRKPVLWEEKKNDSV